MHKYNINIQYGVPKVADTLTICKDKHIFNYLGYYERTSFSISGSALVKDCKDANSGISEVNSKISSLVNKYVKGSSKILENSSIEKDIENLLKNIKPSKWQAKHIADKTGKSKVVATDFILNSSGQIQIWCTDWSKKMFDEHKWEDDLNVSLRSEEYQDYIDSPKYNK